MFFRALLFSCAVFLLTGCGSIRQFSRTGNHPYCLINYNTHIADCLYNSMKDCSKEYNKYEHEIVHCFRKKDLTKNALNIIEGEDDDGNDER